MAQSEPLCAFSFFQSCTSCKSCQSCLLPQRINYPTADRIHKIYKIKRGLSCGPVCVVLCVFVNHFCSPQRINYPTADRIHKIYKIKRGLSCGPVCVVLCVFVNHFCSPQRINYPTADRIHKILQDKERAEWWAGLRCSLCLRKFSVE